MTENEITEFTLALKATIQPKLDALARRVSALEVENRTLRRLLTGTPPGRSKPGIARRPN